MSRTSLPQPFSDLTPFVDAWAYKTEKERHDKLMGSSIDELRPFYDAMLSRMDAITLYLNKFHLDDMPAAEQLLLDLAMGFMESAHPIDLNWKTTDIEDKFPSERFIFFPPSCA